MGRTVRRRQVETACSSPPCTVSLALSFSSKAPSSRSLTRTISVKVLYIMQRRDTTRKWFPICSSAVLIQIKWTSFKPRPCSQLQRWELCQCYTFCWVTSGQISTTLTCLETTFCTSLPEITNWKYATTLSSAKVDVFHVSATSRVCGRSTTRFRVAIKASCFCSENLITPRQATIKRLS